jgi:predicted aspartyl protease
MKTQGTKSVGRFSVEFEVANHVDVINAQQGLLAAERVRRLTISGIVDSGATRLVLPEKVVKQLGLPSKGKVKVTDANKESATRAVVSEVDMELLGRSGVFTAIVEPKRRTALIGAIVLDELDFLVDSTSQRLVPRDPRFVVIGRIETCISSFSVCCWLPSRPALRRRASSTSPTRRAMTSTSSTPRQTG